jgi:hypothetical protein
MFFKKHKLKKINRIEIISPRGREYVKQFEKEQNVIISTQDDGKTLKIFIARLK